MDEGQKSDFDKRNAGKLGIFDVRFLLRGLGRKSGGFAQIFSQGLRQKLTWGFRLVLGVVLVLGIFVGGIVGGEGVSAVGAGDKCYYSQYSVATGGDAQSNNPDHNWEETKTVQTNRVCDDGDKLYATKAEDGAGYKYAVQGKNVCLLWDGGMECTFIGHDNLSGTNGVSLSDGVRLLAKNNIPNMNGLYSEVVGEEKIVLEDELALEERELEKARGDNNTDTCWALKYSYNGEEQYTNKVCRNQNGTLYVITNEEVGGGGLTFTETWKTNQICLLVNGTDKKGCNTLQDNETPLDLLKRVWNDACKDGSFCDGYELDAVGAGVQADRGAEVWEDVNQDQVNNQTSGEGAETICYSGSGPLGWILCPVVQGVSGAGTYMWQQVEDRHLKIPASEIFAEDSGVYSGWELVRNISNVVFVILFMVVIFSQLTGKGIDNYGIKRILPKLIVAAILMNMSYLVCELAVDLSNVLGNGINQLLSDVAGDLTSTVNESSDVSQITGWTASAGLGMGGLAIFTLLQGGLGAGISALGLAALGIVITIVVAMLTLYLILIIREAGIVIMIVLAPVALVCYMLPNTEKWFKKWLDIGKALLVVYPLCGLVVGGGRVAGAILGSIPGMAIAGMLVQVLPFFLIPSLLRRSLSLMGNIGSRVSSTGRNLGRRGSTRAQGTIRGTERFKDWSQYQQEMSTVRRAQRVKNRLGNRKNLSERDTERLSKANAALVSYEGKKKQAMIGADDELGYDIALAHQDVAFANEREKSFSEIFSRNEKRVNQGELERALSGSDAERASAALGTLFQQGGIDEALQVLNNSNLDWANMNSGVRTRILQTMASSNVDVAKSYAKYRQKGGTRSFNQWVRGDMTGVNATEEAKLVKPENMSYAAHLKENGVHAVDSYSKDEMQFVQNNKDSIRTELGEGFYGAMLSSTAVNSKDARVKTLAEDTIAKDISEGKLDIDHLGLTPEMIGAMRDDTALAIKKGYVDMWKRQVPGISDADAERDAMNYIRSNLSKQINAINTDDRIRNRTSKGVKEVFNIRQ